MERNSKKHIFLWWYCDKEPLETTELINLPDLRRKYINHVSKHISCSTSYSHCYSREKNWVYYFVPEVFNVQLNNSRENICHLEMVAGKLKLLLAYA